MLDYIHHLLRCIYREDKSFSFKLPTSCLIHLFHSQPVDLLTRKNEIKHLEDQGELDDNVKAIKDSLVASVKVTNGAELAFFTTKTGLRVDGWAESLNML